MKINKLTILKASAPVSDSVNVVTELMDYLQSQEYMEHSGGDFSGTEVIDALQGYIFPILRKHIDNVIEELKQNNYDRLNQR